MTAHHLATRWHFTFPLIREGGWAAFATAAKATGQSLDLPEHTLQACLDHVAKFVPNAPVPALWGPPVEVAPGAALLDRIVAITGRAP